MTTTAVLLDRALPYWDVSAEIKTELAEVRKVPGQYWQHSRRFSDRLTELLKKEQPDLDRVFFESFLSTEQLAAIIAGDPFCIERTTFFPGVFRGGRLVHLKRLRTGRRAAPCDQGPSCG